MMTPLQKIGLIVAISLMGIALFVGVPVSFTQDSPSEWTEAIDLAENISLNWQAYPIILCDPYQNVHIFWSDNEYGNAALYYRTDINGTWSAPSDVMLSQPEAFYLSGAVSSVNDSLHLVWVTKPANSQLFYGKAPIATAIDARTWTKPLNLDDHVFNSSVQVDLLGNVHIIYSHSDDDMLFYEVLHIMSEDDGITWSKPDVIFSTTFPEPAYIRVETAVDGKNRLHVGLTLRSLEYAKFSEVGYLRSLDNGHTWTDYVTVQDIATAWQGVEWIAPYAFGDDEVHLTWHDPRRMHKWSSDGGETWSEPDEIMQMGAAFGGPNQLVKDSDGVIYALLAELDGVYVIPWDGNVWGQPDLVYNVPIDPHYQHIAVCQGNHLHVVFYDRTGPQTSWYTTRETTAVSIPRKPVPVPTLEPSRNSTQSEDVVVATKDQDTPAESQPQYLDFDRTISESRRLPSTPIFIGAGLATILILIVVTVKWAGRHI